MPGVPNQNTRVGVATQFGARASLIRAEGAGAENDDAASNLEDAVFAASSIVVQAVFVPFARLLLLTWPIAEGPPWPSLEADVPKRPVAVPRSRGLPPCFLYLPLPKYNQEKLVRLG